ncbi:MAG: dihydropteroate synthase [Desulfovibrionaceae bacterium]
MQTGHTWTVIGGRVLGPAPFFIAGIVNVTPDSFYDGGKHFDRDAAVAKGRELAALGAHILDVGGESTRPGSAPTPEAEELERVLPVVSALAGLDPGEAGAPVVSVDTYKARVAEETLKAGAVIINDISACLFEPALADVLAEYKPGYVLMHSQGRPERMQDAPHYDDVVEDLLRFFSERLEFLVGRGLPENRIVIDPGIGFGKTSEHNISILRNIDRFRVFGLPVYMGLSNKSVLGSVLDLKVGERTNATVAATVMSYVGGAAVHRVHDVAAAHQALTVASRLI